MYHVAELIRQTRRDKNLTQNDIVEATNTTASFISLVEKSRSKLPIPLAKIIVTKFKLNRTAFRKAYEMDYTDTFVDEWNNSK